MAEISEIVSISITRASKSVQQTGFGVEMFLDLHKRFNERFRIYATTAAMVSDGFAATDKAFIAASNYFSQNPSPSTIIIGRHATDDLTVVTFGAAASGDVVTLRIAVGTDAEETFTHTSSGSESATVVGTAMHTLINASGTLDLTSTDNVDGTIDLSPDVATTAWSLKITGDATAALTATESLTAALTAVSNANDTWYGIGCYSALEADILEVATYTESNKKLFGYGTSNADDKTTALTGIGDQLKALSRDRTFGMWNAGGGVSASDPTGYAGSAWMGDRFSSDPGGSTWAFKTLSGISVDLLTPTESSNIQSHNLNTYETAGGVNITRDGIVASGEYIDIIRGIDWLEARMAERIYSRLVNLPKIPYTDAGIAVVNSGVYG